MERDLECDLRVSSLPDGPGSSSQSSRLASLRPPATTPTLLATAPSKVVASTPFRPIENHLSTPNSLPLHSKAASKLGNLSGSNSTGKFPSSSGNNNSMSLVKGLRTLANGVGIRSGSTVK